MGNAFVRKVVPEEVDWTPVQAFLTSAPVVSFMEGLHAFLERIGVPRPFPDAEQMLLSVGVMLGTLLLYYIFLGDSHERRRARLAKDLKQAQRAVHELEIKLDELNREKLNKRRDSSARNSGKQIRVWMDGAFDMLHYGHMNAFRLGREHGTHLVVGINSDKSIKTCKGTAPVMNDEERLSSVAGCKFVDEVVENVPYVMTAEYLDMVVKKYKIDYVVHGDDPCIVDGKDVYEIPKKLGFYRGIPRTEGVSTTDIVGRMLLVSKDHHDKGPVTDGSSPTSLLSRRKDSTFKRPSKLFATSRMMKIFAAGSKPPSPGAKIVYVDGAFDMFHMGHIEILKKAKAMGDYLIVGIHNDGTVNKHRGLNYPILNMQERVLSVLGCRYVDDVLMDAPWSIPAQLIKSLKIDLVVAGKSSDYQYEERELNDHYTVPKEMGILSRVESGCKLTLGDIVERVMSNEGVYRKKFEKKNKAEEDYYNKRYGNKGKK